MIDANQAVSELVIKAMKTEKSDDALKFSQAACNVANARASMMIEPESTKEDACTTTWENTG